ncbi:FHA domain-containing protein [Phytohabitans kaempferiae]|uniref:FHA domain-containing protein n=1 Tax=Phytohabitans kaempferiae TaxID=1620943 RepID=A0ABV6M4U2_9ACTN
MPELSVVEVRAGSWREPAKVLLKDPVGDRYLTLTAAASATGHQAGAGISGGLVRDLLDAVGAPARHVEIGEASAGSDRVVLVVGEGVRVPAALLDAVSFAREAGLPIRCAEGVLAAEGAATSPGSRWSLADPAPTSAYRMIDLDETTQMEVIQPASVTGGSEAPVMDAPVGAAVLQIRQGPGAGAAFVLDGDVVSCGRDGGSDVVLDGATVSRKHAEFHRQGVGYTVSDLDSLNGTYVNGERVKTAALVPGDEIRIGRYRLTFVAG